MKIVLKILSIEFCWKNLIFYLNPSVVPGCSVRHLHNFSLIPWSKFDIPDPSALLPPTSLVKLNLNLQPVSDPADDSRPPSHLIHWERVTATGGNIGRKFKYRVKRQTLATPPTGPDTFRRIPSICLEYLEKALHTPRQFKLNLTMKFSFSLEWCAWCCTQ